MSIQAVQSPKSIRDSVSEAEWEARVLLAAAYRITAMQGAGEQLLAGAALTLNQHVHRSSHDPAHASRYFG